MLTFYPISLSSKINYYSLQMTLIETDHIYGRPYVIASGITISYDNTNFTFSMTPTQYLNLSHSALPFPIFSFIDPESAKWKNKKPVPSTGSTISIGGFLTKIKRDDDNQPVFEIELDTIAYLARQSTASTSSPNRAS